MIEDLCAELEHQRRGWLNAVEQGVIGSRYRKDTDAMICGVAVALAKAGKI